MSGRRSVKTASTTTPLISITLPTFFAVDPFSAMGLLKGGFRGAAQRGSEPPAKRGQSNRAPRRIVAVLAAVQAVLLERVRHTGGVVEVSAVRGDRGSENGHSCRV